VDGEVYRRHHELDTAAARKEVDARLGWAPSRRFQATAAASYAQAAMAGELNTLVGLSVGRVPAQRLAASGAFTWHLGGRTQLALDHTFTRDRVEALPDSDAHRAGVVLSRQASAKDQLRLGYVAKRFTFTSFPTTSQAVVLGWKRDLSPRTQFELAAGPSRTGDETAPEVSASVRQQFRRGEATLGYLRTKTTVVGRPGPVSAEGVTATLSRRLLRSVDVAATPSFYRVSSAESRTTVQQVSVEVRYRLARALSLALGHVYSIQRGALYLSDDPGLDTSAVVRNAVVLRIVAGPAGP
jgi:hypothetical protein